LIDDSTQHIANLIVALHFPEAQSLKEKRMVLKSLKARVRNEFNVSIGEIGGLDKWQTATLAFVMTGYDQRHIDSALQNLLSFVERFPRLELCEHQLEFL
jgi:uncharacterized protein YlxP (DUF503 family)